MSENKPDLMAELAEVVAKIDAYRAMDFCLARKNTYTDAASAAAEFIRTHHAELDAVVRDAAAYRKLVAGIDADQLVAASVKHGDALGVLKDAARYRYIRSAPAGTVRADFHSWAPSYHYWGNGKSLDESIDTAMRAGEG